MASLAGSRPWIGDFMIQQRVADIMNPSADRLAQINAQYRSAARETLAQALAGCESPAGVFSKMKGMFPSDVVLLENGQALKCENYSCSPAPEYHPELHALDYEWYFTTRTAHELSGEYGSRNGVTICLGAPKVAIAAIHQSRSVVLVDKNPCLLNRFPELGRSEEVHLMDAIDSGRLRLRADAVIFDAPWYLTDTMGWLFAASQLVRAGGSIIFALYPSLVRPSALLERELILDIASTIGSLEVHQEALVYETPLFEQEVLYGSGLPCMAEWRRGDLVCVTASKPLASLPPGLLYRPSIDGAWRSFVIGEQVVKVRKRLLRLRHSEQREDLLAPVGTSFLLDSVSVRAPQREIVDVWTSRNRAARSSNTSLVSLLLRRLARGESLPHAIGPYVSRIPGDFGDQLCELLAMGG